MRLLIVILVLLLVTLQFQLWVGKGSLAEVYSLKREVAALKEEITAMRERNRELLAEVKDLQSKREWIEERAREDLGMIRKGEVFYQVIEPKKGTTGGR